MRNPFKRKPKVEVRLSHDTVVNINRSTVETQIEKMREAHRKLGQLLEKPQPGLITWYQAVGQCLRIFKNIHDGVDGGE